MAYAGIDLPAALVGAVLAYALGALWYSPALFARPWMAAVGKREEDLEGGATAAYLTAGIAWLVAALALAYLLARIPLDGPADALLLVTAAWLLPGAATLLNGGFEGRPWALWAINNGYLLVGFLLIGATIAYWPL